MSHHLKFWERTMSVSQTEPKVLKPEYVRQVHTHVLFTPGFLNPEEDRAPVTIVHHTGEYVWITVSYHNDFHDDVVQVTDGRINGYDEDGNKIVSVPVHYVERYMDENEAEQWYRAASAAEHALFQNIK